MTAEIPIKIKHAGKIYDTVFSFNETGKDFKSRVESLTGVPSDRMKVMMKSGLLKDEDNLVKFKSTLKPNQVIIVIGSATQLPKPPQEPVKFLEDLNKFDLIKSSSNNLPLGLRNLGNTCYLNSSLQLIRSIPELKTHLNDGISDNGSSFVKSLKALLNQFNNSVDSITPSSFLNNLRLNHPQFNELDRYGGYAQQDAEEAYNSILNSLNNHNFIDKYMKGTLVKTMINDEDNSEEPTISYEDFNKLSCNISINTNYLENGLIDNLNEKIEKYSSHLNKNSTYNQSSKISRLPSYLSVHLVRFYWRSDLRKKAKILRKVKFPYELDTLSLVDDGLKSKIEPLNLKFKQIEKNRDERKRLRNKIKTKFDLEQKAKESNNEMLIDESEKLNDKEGNQELEDENVIREREHLELTELIDEDLRNDQGCSLTGLYDLIGIISHKGLDADGGHYISWVRSDVFNDQNEKHDWFKFDDDKVTKVNEDVINRLEGGGEDSVGYLLLYKSKSI